MQALDLKRKGWKQREIAAFLDVTEAAVSQWFATARCGGPDALRSHPRPGPIPRLTDEELHRLPDFLWHGPEAYGFRGEVWTCGRIAGVIAQEFGIRYSKSQVSRLLKQLEWTPQVPIVRAIQRDEAAIELWRAEVWPELLHRARREHRELVFVDESGFYLLPGVVKTYAPKGQTPVVREWQTRDHLSVMGAVTPCGKTYTMVREESLNGLHAIEFLLHLGHVAGDRLLMIWDGSPIHRRAEVGEFLAEVGRAIHLEILPPYAPDLNPVEWMWKHLKQVELRNLACLDFEMLHMELHLALGRLRRKSNLVHSFFEGAGLVL
jgi:transposase